MCEKLAAARFTRGRGVALGRRGRGNWILYASIALLSHTILSCGEIMADTGTSEVAPTVVYNMSPHIVAPQTTPPSILATSIHHSAFRKPRKPIEGRVEYLL